MKHAKDTGNSFWIAINQSNISAILCIGMSCALLTACNGQIAEQPSPPSGSVANQATNVLPGRAQTVLVSADRDGNTIDAVAAGQASSQNLELRKEIEEVA